MDTALLILSFGPQHREIEMDERGIFTGFLAGYRVSLAPNFHNDSPDGPIYFWQATVTAPNAQSGQALFGHFHPGSALKEALRALPDAPNFSVELLCE